MDTILLQFCIANLETATELTMAISFPLKFRDTTWNATLSSSKRHSIKSMQTCPL